MKSTLLLVGLAVAMLATPALAVSLPSDGNPYRAKIEDLSNLYRDMDGVGALDAVPLDRPFPGGGQQIGDEQRTMFRVTDIFNGSNDNKFNLTSSTELTGVLYNLDILAVIPTAGGILVDFGQSTRNPLTTDFNLDTTGADGMYGTADDPTKPISGTPIKTGGVLEIYEDAAKNFNRNPNGVADYDTKLPASGAGIPVAMDPGATPTLWSEGGLAGHAPTTDGTQPVGADNLLSGAGVTDGNYWLAGVLLELDYLVEAGIFAAPIVPFTSGTLLRETIAPGQGQGSGQAFINVVGGSFASQILTGFGGGLVDLSLRFNLFGPTYDPVTDTLIDNLDYQGPGQWTVESEDPVRFGTVPIPEPTTLSILGLGLAGLIGARRRRK